MSGGMRYKSRIAKILQEFAKELKEQESQDPDDYQTLEFIREKSFLKAKPIIDHLELRNLDASKLANELMYHYMKKKEVVLKCLIIGIIYICMDKCNKQFGSVKKNILASQADTVITKIMIHSLKTHREYDPVIVLTFDCLRAYLDTCRVYEQGIFEEQTLMDLSIKFTNSEDKVLVHCNRAISALVLYSSTQTVLKNQDSLIDYVFNVLKSHKQAIENRDQSHSEPVLDTHSDHEDLINSSLEILHSLGSKLDSEPEALPTFVDRILHHLAQDKFQPHRFSRQILCQTVVNKNSQKLGRVLENTLTELLTQIYLRVSSMAREQNKAKLTEEEVEGMAKVLGDLYSLQPESHALNANNTLVFQAFWEMGVIEARIFENFREESTVSEAIQEAFGSFIDGLSDGKPGVEDKLPGYKTRYKAIINLFDYAYESSYLSNLDMEKEKQSAARNYLKLFQVALSVLYGTRLTESKQENHEVTVGHPCSFTSENVTDLTSFATSSLAETVKYEGFIDNIIDCVVKMMKYEQMFNPENYEFQVIALQELAKLAPSLSDKIELGLMVAVKNTHLNPESAVSVYIPGFLSAFNSAVKTFKKGNQKVNDSYRAIKVLRMTEICAEETESPELEKLVESQISKTGIDTTSVSYSKSHDAGWVEGYISKFKSYWKSHVQKNGQVDLDDISVAENDIKQGEIEEGEVIGAGAKSAQSDLLKTLVNKLQRTDAESGDDPSQMLSSSVMESSKFSLDEATYNSDGDDDEKSLMSYIHKYS